MNNPERARAERERVQTIFECEECGHATRIHNLIPEAQHNREVERLHGALKIAHAAIVTTLGAQGEDQPTFGQLISAESVARFALRDSVKPAALYALYPNQGERPDPEYGFRWLRHRYSPGTPPAHGKSPERRWTLEGTSSPTHPTIVDDGPWLGLRERVEVVEASTLTALEERLAEARRQLWLAVGSKGAEETLDELAQRTRDEIKRLSRGWRDAEARADRAEEALRKIADGDVEGKGDWGELLQARAREALAQPPSEDGEE